ncbi:MAG: hypothetical protein AW07_04049 [Candidatus Accumulibacter sp. SK-11]|nr:MAG: hypothetical protein AW07_04049 [Candidatus Accumulibacter sp. SK-11]
MDVVELCRGLRFGQVVEVDPDLGVEERAHPGLQLGNVEVGPDRRAGGHLGRQLELGLVEIVITVGNVLRRRAGAQVVRIGADVVVEVETVGQAVHIVAHALLQRRVAREIEAAGQQLGAEEVVADVEVERCLEGQRELGLEDRERRDRELLLERIAEVELEAGLDQRCRGLALQHAEHGRWVVQEREGEVAVDVREDIVEGLVAVLDLLERVGIGVFLRQLDLALDICRIIIGTA